MSATDSKVADARRFARKQAAHGFTLRELRTFVGLTDREGDEVLKRLKREGRIEYWSGKWWPS